MITMKEICISQGSAVTFFRCGGQIHKHVCLICAGFCVPKFTKLGYSFWATVSKTVRPMLSDRCLSCLSVCNAGVSRPNGWTDQDETWRAGRPRPRPHCVRWGPSSPPKGHSFPIFGPYLLYSQMARWIKMPHGRKVGLGPGHIMRDWDPAALPKRGHSPSPNFRSMFVLAKRQDGSKCHLARW